MQNCILSKETTQVYGYFFFFTYMDICIHNRTKIYLFAYNLILHSSNVIIHSEQVVINLQKKKKRKKLTTVIKFLKQEIMEHAIHARARTFVHTSALLNMRDILDVKWHAERTGPCFLLYVSRIPFLITIFPLSFFLSIAIYIYI